MNVSFFLKPKAEVVYVYDTDPVRTALDRMFESGFTAIPVLSAKGRYVGTITEGDFLRLLLGHTPEQAGNMLLSEVTRRIHHRSVTIDTRMEDLVELVAGLRKFYQETGVQPYVYILPNGESTSVPDLKSRAEALYPQLFTDEAHFLLVFCDDGRGGYNCGYTVGSQAKTVMDNEAVSILADYLDRYYNDSSVSEEEIFSNAFAKTADRIMTVTQSPVVPVAVCIAAVIVIALLVFSLQKRREAKERQRQADEKMWSTPLESFGADEAAERAKKIRKYGHTYTIKRKGTKKNEYSRTFLHDHQGEHKRPA